MDLSSGIDLSVLFVSIAIFLILSGILGLQWKADKKRRADFTKFLIFTFMAIGVIILKSVIIFGFDLIIPYLILIIGFFLFFLTLTYQSWNRLDKKLFYLVIFFGILMIIFRILEMFIIRIYINLISNFSTMLCITFVFLLIIKIIIDVRSDKKKRLQK